MSWFTRVSTARAPRAGTPAGRRMAGLHLRPPLSVRGQGGRDHGARARMTTAPLWLGTSWKMTKTGDQAVEYARSLVDGLRGQPAWLRSFVILPATALAEVSSVLCDRSSDWCAERGPPWAAFPKPTASYSPTNPSRPSATMAAKPVRRRSSRSAQPCAPSGAAGSWPSYTAARSTPATHRSSWRSRASTASSSAVPRGRSRAT